MSERPWWGKERVWVRWHGEHASHAVYERTDGRVICDTCKVVLKRRRDAP